MINSINKTFTTDKGVKISQMILEECALPEMKLFSQLQPTNLNKGGFGIKDKSAKTAVVIEDDDPTTLPTDYSSTSPPQ